MFGLIPKEEKFFIMFQALTNKLIEGAGALKEMLDDYTKPSSVKELIKDIEHQCDLQTHEIIHKLNTSFITPFDREDIYSLASALDDIMDAIDASAQHIVLYHVTEITADAKMLAFIILKACQTLGKACVALEKQPKEVCSLNVEVNSLENEADRIRADAISRLFEEEKDPIQLIKWKEVYENLEFVTDKCEDASNILESIVLKNA